jgi:hypothetical protein
MVETSIPFLPFIPLPKVLVSQNACGPHDADIWVPKGCSELRTDGSASDLKIDSLAQLDGDHVLIGFLDGRFTDPVIVRSLPHPTNDAGKETLASDEDIVGYRQRVSSRSGYGGAPIPVAVRKINGIWWGVGDDGNFTVDLTRARGWASSGSKDGAFRNTDGGIDDKGHEVPNTTIYDDDEGDFKAGDAYMGNAIVRLPANGTLIIKTAGGKEIRLRDADGSLVLDVDTIQIGSDATQSAVLADGLDKWLRDAAAGLSVQTAFGPSGPAIRPLANSGAIKPISTTVKIKD